MTAAGLRMRLVTTCLILAVCVALGTAVKGVADFIQADTAFAKENLIRLHVIANSDLPQDQDLKLRVRDAVLATARDLFAAVDSKTEARRVLLENQSLLVAAAEQVVHAHGFSYPVTVEFGTYPFPDRTYQGITLPAGTYDALQVRIGQARGSNWWCVLFPPLCFGELETSGGSSELGRFNSDGMPGRIAFRWKVLDFIRQMDYAQHIRSWWQAYAADVTRWNTE